MMLQTCWPGPSSSSHPHPQAVRALAAHPTENTFASGAADNIKKFKLPFGEFLHNTLQQQKVPLRAVLVVIAREFIAFANIDLDVS